MEAQFLEAILKPLNFLLSEHSGKLNAQKRWHVAVDGPWFAHLCKSLTSLS